MYISKTQEGLLGGYIIFFSRNYIWVKGYSPRTSSGVGELRDYQSQLIIHSINNTIIENKWYSLNINNICLPEINPSCEWGDISLDQDRIIINKLFGRGKLGLELSPGWEVCIDDIFITQEKEK